MRNTLYKKRSEGFTIIEVMIVLAIAGVIMLAVFLAVPALQRNSRNTQSKNDAQSVAAGITDSMSVSDGKLPTGIAGTGTVTLTNTNNVTIKVNGATVVSVVGAKPADGNAVDGKIQVVLKKKCAPNDTVDNNRGAAIYYLTEGSSKVLSCLEV